MTTIRLMYLAKTTIPKTINGTKKHPQNLCSGGVFLMHYKVNCQLTLKSHTITDAALRSATIDVIQQSSRIHTTVPSVSTGLTNKALTSAPLRIDGVYSPQTSYIASLFSVRADSRHPIQGYA